MHTYHTRTNNSATDVTIRRTEMEDQTVTTVLEPEGLVDEDEDDRHWPVRNGIARADRKILHQTMELQKSGT